MSLFWRSHLTVSLSMAASLSVLTLSPLYAAGLTQHYIIPAGSLSAALLAASQQSRQLIVFNPADLDGYSSKALEGDFAIDQLLDRLLTGHRLSHSRDARGAIIVKPAENQTSTQSDEKLPVMVVYGQSQNEGGLASTNTATTRTNTPLRLTPQSISVINSDIIDAQGARTVTDVLKNVAGVTVIPGSIGSSSVNMRGYSTGVLSDGLGGASGSTPLSVPAIALQSVESFKGPSAILSGAGSPGGVINLVYKKPELEAAHEVRLGYGSYDERQISADTTGALFGSDNLSYRVILDDRESRRNAAGYDGMQEFYFSPSLRWQDEDTDFMVRYSRIQRTTPFQPYTVGYNGKPWSGHLPEPLGNKDDNLSLSQNEFNLSLQQTLSEHWQYVGKATYTTAKSQQYGWYSGTTLQDDNSVWLNTFYQAADAHQLGLDNYVRGNYEWDGLKSTTVLGMSASRSRTVIRNQAAFRDWVPVNIYEPLPDLPSAKAAYIENFSQSIPVGAYWQQQLSYGKWNLNAGLRFSSSWNGVFRREEATEGQKRQVWSPSIGLAYEVASWMTVYASHLEGYQPPAFFDRNGNLLPDQTSKQNEAGMKFTLLGEKLVVTTAAYRTVLSNYSYFDMEEGGYVSTPGYISRGFEVEAQGSLTANWDVVGSYNYGRTEFVENTTFHVGLPRHKASLWTRYRFSEGLFKGLSAGVGMYYSSVANLDDENEYKIPAQVQTDLNVGYSIGNYSLDLTARNIFNENLYITSLEGDPTFISLQQPRSVQLTGSYRF